ncbi:LuxR C-terminal-related transcriptional regulator [Thalassotalea fonticola]|uniref:LuxR C-terminal-related transcriptional regulator n=1 Tax=Thalassotalea fonticola TaxID=3065649 RepID=A0ABZ0GQF7_9GAMM|nr:LuxR C-terminal-related transcriptional regulator [Colwelliaceae bacterium S1-1]
MLSKPEKEKIQHQSTVIVGKLLKPKLSENIINRELVKTFSSKIIKGIRAALIVAPAGYGKSILLAQSSDVLTDKGYNCNWLSIDTKDNDPLRFLSLLIASIGEQDSLERNIAVGYFGVERKTAIDYLITDIANYLEAQPCKYAFFIDDYHAISNPEVDSILERLINYSPQQTVFIIASRNEPKLALNTLKVREEVLRFTRIDLAFALDESEKFLNTSKQLGLDSKLVSALADRTEGWVAGLQLASLALAGSSDYEKFICEFTGTDRDVTDYLGEVILSRQNDEVRRFLLWSSVLDRMSAELVNYVLSIDSAQAMLEYLEDKSLFIIPLDRNRIRYRYHHLFGDFLRNALNKEYPSKTEKICHRACTWYVEHGNYQEAINYALIAKDYSQALDLIARISKKLILESGENWTLLNWVQQLPDGYVLKRPEIGLAYSWSLIFNRQPGKARNQLEQLEGYCQQHAKTLSPDLLEHLRSGIKIDQFLVEAVCDNTFRCSTLVKEWLAENPNREGEELLTALVLEGYTSLSTFKFEQGEAAVNKAILIGKQCSIDYLEAWALAVAGLLKVQKGDLNEATKLFIKGLKQNNKYAQQYSYMGSLNAVLLAEAYYEKNEIVKAEELLYNRFEYIDSQSVVEVSYSGYRVMANLQLIKSGLDSALEIIRLGKESADRAELPRLKALLTAQEIHYLLRHGKRKEAQIIAKDSGFDESRAPTFDEDSRQVFQEIRELVRAELNLHNNLPKKALAILNAQIVQCKETGRHLRLMEGLLLRCRALYALKRTDDAVADVSQALSLAEKGGFYRLFLDAGVEIHQLLRLVVKGDVNKQTENVIVFLGEINELLLTDSETQESKTKPDQPQDTLLEPMTKRERQMLDFIKTGETNKDIADKLFISEQTVKWHLHQLYKKLGVKNRTSAIAKARALLLI